jgi:hypothetical protein
LGVQIDVLEARGKSGMRKHLIRTLKYSIPALLLCIGLIAQFLPRIEITVSPYSLSLSIGRAMAADTISIGELTEQRTESSKTFYLGNNRYSIDSSIGAIHYKADYKDEKAAWLDIDTTIDPYGNVNKAPYDLQIYLTGAPGFRITSKTSGSYDIRLKEARISDTDVTKVSADTKVAVKLSRNTATWVEYYPGVDVILSAGNGGVSFQRLIKTSTAPKEYDVAITTISSGELKVLPIVPATDALKQDILMESKPTADGRTETLKLTVLSPDARAIAYPILDGLEVQVGAGADDGGRSGATTFSATGSYQSLGVSNARDGFFRFTGVTISGTIDASHILLFSNTQSGSPELKIYGIDEDNPAAPTTLAELDADVLTTAGVDWDGAFNDEAWNESGSLNGIFQELVDSYTISGDAVMIHINGDNSGNAGYNQVRTYEQTPTGTLAAKLHIDFTVSGGDPSLTNTPNTLNLGTLWQERSYYAKGNAPGNPVETGNCTFEITNNGSVTVNITASMSNMTGGTSWNVTSGAPGLNTFRITAYVAGIDPSTGVVLLTSAQAFYNGLTAQGTKKWDFKFETGTWADSDNSTKTGTLQLTAIAP